MPLQKTPFMDRRRIVSRLETLFEQQKALLVEAAGAFRQEGTPVPPELGEALGAIAVRSRLFQQVSQVVLEGYSPSVGTKKVITKFLEDAASYNEAIKKTLEVLQESACKTPPNAS